MFTVRLNMVKICKKVIQRDTVKYRKVRNHSLYEILCISLCDFLQIFKILNFTINLKRPYTYLVYMLLVY